MNRAEHYAAAERLIDQANPSHLGEMSSDEKLKAVTVLLMRAQVHATLAAADVDLDRQARQATAYRKLCGCSFLPDPHIEGASCPPVGPPRAERVLPPGYNPQYQGTRSVTPDPFKHPCECLGAPNGRHERGVFVGCIWARHLSDGPGQ